MVDIEKLAREQYPKIKDHFVKTDLIQSKINKKLLIKTENLQVTGSFKIRGASSKIIELQKKGTTKIIAASTGNHGLAVAKLADELDIKLILYVPTSISQLKEEKLRKYDLELIKIDGDSDKSEIEARTHSISSEIPFLSPYNDEYVIAGQASIAIELETQIDLESIDKIYITIGGGGLVSGVGSILKKKYPHIEIIGCQPFNSKTMFDSIQKGKIIETDHKPTLSDGSAGGMELDSITFDIAKELIDRFILVKESEIADAIRLVFSKDELRVEGSSGVAIGAFLKDNKTGQTSEHLKKSIAISCGGNIDPKVWNEVING